MDKLAGEGKIKVPPIQTVWLPSCTSVMELCVIGQQLNSLFLGHNFPTCAKRAKVQLPRGLRKPT